MDVSHLPFGQPLFFLSVSREPDNDNSTPEHPEKVILLPDYQLYNYNYL
jgi:hypothetical protein